LKSVKLIVQTLANAIQEIKAQLKVATGQKEDVQAEEAEKTKAVLEEVESEEVVIAEEAE